MNPLPWAEHERETDGIKQNAAQAGVHHAFHQHVHRFARAAETGFEHREADLHSEHEERRDQRPRGVDGIHDIVTLPPVMGAGWLSLPNSSFLAPTPTAIPSSVGRYLARSGSRTVSRASPERRRAGDLLVPSDGPRDDRFGGFAFRAAIRAKRRAGKDLAMHGRADRARRLRLPAPAKRTMLVHHAPKQQSSLEPKSRVSTAQRGHLSRQWSCTGGAHEGGARAPLPPSNGSKDSPALPGALCRYELDTTLCPRELLENFRCSAPSHRGDEENQPRLRIELEGASLR
jgi:hypothetical protein